MPGYRMKGLPDARLWEIAENLHRAELTVQERAEHIAEWVRLTGEKVAQLAPPSGGVQPSALSITNELAPKEVRTHTLPAAFLPQERLFLRDLHPIGLL